jgi:hypothetical protein
LNGQPEAAATGILNGQPEVVAALFLKGQPDGAAAAAYRILKKTWNTLIVFFSWTNIYQQWAALKSILNFFGWNKLRKIAKNSATTKAREEINIYLETLEFWEKIVVRFH